MATTRKPAKSSKSKKTPAKRARIQGTGNIVFTENSIVIALNEADKRKIKQCLARSGKITFSIKEHSVTRLPEILDNGKLID